MKRLVSVTEAERERWWKLRSLIEMKVTGTVLRPCRFEQRKVEKEGKYLFCFTTGVRTKVVLDDARRTAVQI